MRRLEWLFVAIIAAFLATAAIAQLVAIDAPAKVATVRPVAHFVSWPMKSQPVPGLCPTPARRA